jgi:hypothetical protein
MMQIYTYAGAMSNPPSETQELSDHVLTMSFAGTVQDNPDQVILRLMSPKTLNACAVTQDQSTIILTRKDKPDEPPHLSFEISSPEPSDGLLRFHSYHCNETSTQGQADIYLSRQQISQLGITRLRLKFDVHIAFFNLQLHDNELTLTPISSDSGKPSIYRLRDDAPALKFHFQAP